MASSSSGARSSNRSGTGRADVSQEECPALALDLATCEITSANAAGLAAFGMATATALPIALDSAMPALGRLRELSRSPRLSALREPLRLWLNGRIVTLDALLEPPPDVTELGPRIAILRMLANPDERPHRVNGSGHASAPRIAPERVQVSFLALKPEPQPTVAPPPPARPVAAPSTPAMAPTMADADAAPTVETTRTTETPPVRTDADVLREIARRIREGVAAQASQAPETETPAEPLCQQTAASEPRTETEPKPEPKSEPDPETLQVSAPDHGAVQPPAQERVQAYVQTPAPQPDREHPQRPEHEHEPAPPPPPRTAPGTHPLRRQGGDPMPVDDMAHLVHELKTPLTAIAAAAEIMRDERLGAMGNERYLSYAADIHASATHALSVITSLLARTGRVDAAELRAEALDLNALAARATSLMQPLAAERGLTLEFDTDGSSPTVVASKTAVNQIVLNLLTNALKFTPRGGDVRVVTGYLDDGSVFLAVRDTGVGMSGAHRELPEDAALDERALRVGLARGQGIGLPLVRRLVRAMGAEMDIDSAPGKGTVVLIAFARG